MKPGGSTNFGVFGVASPGGNTNFGVFGGKLGGGGGGGPGGPGGGLCERGGEEGLVSWFILSRTLRIRLISTADGLLPVTGPSSRTLCCTSRGNLRSASVALLSILVSARKTAMRSTYPGGGKLGGNAPGHIP